MKETNEVLLLEQRIWNDDPAIREIAFNISYKIQTIDYASKGMTPIKAGPICYTLIFLLTPFFVNILANFKYVPSFQQ
uniref:Uncharacterized protein n=1 Tax=Panagrolaimus davidi TaxID=227884 RepID=A0A914PZF6_9BILA